MDQIHQGVGIKTLVSQSLDHAAFTDGGAAAGNIAFTTGQIPANSIIPVGRLSFRKPSLVQHTCTATVGPPEPKDAWAVAIPLGPVVPLALLADWDDTDCF